MKRSLRLCFAILLLLSLTAVSTAKTPLVGMSLMTLDSPFFAAMERGAREAAEQLGIELNVVDARLDISRQISGIENLISRGAKVLLINAVDSDAIAPAVLAANEVGIPVVAIDVMASGGELATLVASDNYAAGLLAAEYVGKCLQDGGKIGLIGGPPITSFTERIEGFKEGIKEYSNVEIVRFDRVTQNSLERFVSVAENMLLAEPDLDFIFSINDFGSIAVNSVVESFPISLKVNAVGVDGMPDALNAIAAGGAVRATVAQQPAEMGRLAVETAAKILANEPIEDFVAVPLELVTEENVAGFSW